MSGMQPTAHTSGEQRAASSEACSIYTVPPCKRELTAPPRKYLHYYYYALVCVHPPPPPSSYFIFVALATHSVSVVCCTHHVSSYDTIPKAFLTVKKKNNIRTTTPHHSTAQSNKHHQSYMMTRYLARNMLHPVYTVNHAVKYELPYTSSWCVNTLTKTCLHPKISHRSTPAPYSQRYE